MTPIDQNNFGKIGNCLTACLASMFDLKLEEVPNFWKEPETNDKQFWENVYAWLARMGYTGIIVPWRYTNHVDGHLIVMGFSPRGNWHATIWRDNQLIHDPHPEKTGLEEPKQCFLIFKKF